MHPRHLAKLMALLLGATLAGCGGDSGSAAERSATSAIMTNGVNATLAVQSSSSTSICWNVTLANTSTAQVTSWTVGVTLASATYTQVRNATASVSGSLVTVRPSWWGGGIAPGASVSFSLCARPAGPNPGATLTSLQVTGGATGPTSYTLTVGASTGGTTSPAAGTYSYAAGSVIQVTATPASGYAFSGWSGAASGTANPVSVTMDGAKTLTPSFSPTSTSSSISVNAGGSASGSFVADAHFSGGSTYSTTSTIDTSLLTGTIPPQAVFRTERYGEFTYTIPNLTPGSGQTVTLYFQESYWSAAGQRTFDVAVNGAAALTAFDIFAAAGGRNRAVARTFETTANASGQVVIRFTKGGGPDNPKLCGLTVAGAGTTPNTFALTVTKAGTGSGTVSGAGIACGSTCSATYASGTSVTLTASAAAGSTFAGWSGACSGTATCTVSMTAARAVTATFTGSSPGNYVVAMVQSTRSQASELTTADVASLVSSAVAQAGGLDFIRDGQTVVLKPNLVTAYTDGGKSRPADPLVNGISTDWRVVKAVADLVRARNPSGRILVMEGSVNATARAYSMLGYTASNFGSSVDEFIALEGSSCADRTTGALEQRTAVSGKRYWINSRYVNADVVISLPTMKTHVSAGITGAVKNLGIGVTPVGQFSAGTNASDDCTRGQSSTYIDHSGPEPLGQFIRDYYSLRPADFVVMDALQGLEHGPLPAWDNSGTYDYASSRKNMRLILAGRNAVAVDTIESLVMMCDPKKVPHLTKLEADGLGTTDAASITVVGKSVSEVAKPFAGKQTAICPGTAPAPTGRPAGACQAGASYPAPILTGTPRLLYRPSGTVPSGTYEGPVWLAASSTLLLSDLTFSGSVHPSQLLRATPAGAVSTWVSDAGTNGMAVDGSGAVFACSHKVQGIVRVGTNGTLTTYVDNVGGQKFNSPNDLALRSDGTIYFTDPDFQLGNRTSQTGRKGVYRVTPSGAVSLVDGTFVQPNGIALSPNQGVLYVADYGGNVVRAFTVAADGSTSGRRDFVRVTSPDGLGMDCLGNLYVASGAGSIQVFSPSGSQLGSVGVASGLSNLAFGGSDGRTLFITAGKALYALDMNLPGYFD